MAPPAVPPMRLHARFFLLLVLALVACGLGGCQRKGTIVPEPGVAAEPAATPMLELRRVEGREQLLYQTEAPAAHGYGRGDLLGVFAKVEGELDAVGYGHVTQVRGQTVEMLTAFLPDKHRKASLWMGPLPDDEHLGHRIGKVLESPDTGRFHIDVGHAEDVPLGDMYRVFDVTITDANFDARTQQKRPVGLLQVVKVDDGNPVLLTVLRQGSAPRGAWVELIDAEVPGMAMADAREHITVLILHLVDERVGEGEGEDPQRVYWKKLRDVLRSEEVAMGKQSVLQLAFTERKRALVDGSQSAIVAVGQQYGADLVLWGSLQCSSSEACVQPNITFVNQEKFGEEARLSQSRLGPKDDLVGSGDDVGGVDRSIRGLASWLTGLAYYGTLAYEDAAYYLEQVPLEGDLHREWLKAQGSLFRCYEVLGDWGKAEVTARLVIDYGTSTEQEWVEARGRADLAENLYDRGLYDEALAQARHAIELAEADGDMTTVVSAWGRVGDILYERGDLEKALHIRKEKALPVYQKLGDVFNEAITWGKIGDILYKRGELDEALRIRKEKELPVYQKLGDVFNEAITWGAVGDILVARGELDEALRIRKEKELPVYEELGDIRAAAVTWGYIGDILVARGELDEALRIRKEKQLPAFEKLGDVRHEAIVWGHIGDILFARRELEEALRIHKERELPVYEKLGDVRNAAVTWGKIANIFAAQGYLDEAIATYDARVLPASEALGDRRVLAIDRWWLAIHLLARNDNGDRRRAETLLHLSLKDAKAMRLPEANTIRSFMSQAGIEPEDPA